MKGGKQTSSGEGNHTKKGYDEHWGERARKSRRVVQKCGYWGGGGRVTNGVKKFKEEREAVKDGIFPAHKQKGGGEGRGGAKSVVGRGGGGGA